MKVNSTTPVTDVEVQDKQRVAACLLGNNLIEQRWYLKQKPTRCGLKLLCLLAHKLHTTLLVGAEIPPDDERAKRSTPKPQHRADSENAPTQVTILNAITGGRRGC